MKTGIFDIETDGLDASVIHCLCAEVVETGELISAHTPGDVADAIRYLATLDRLVAHNGVGFDYRVLNKLYKFNIRDQRSSRLLDSLVLSRVLFGNLKDFDMTIYAKNKNFPAKMIGRHGLEAWGIRLDMHKGDYSAEMKAKGIDPWAKFNPDMLAYCQNDVAVTKELWQTMILPLYEARTKSFKTKVKVSWTGEGLSGELAETVEIDVPVPDEAYAETTPIGQEILSLATQKLTPTPFPKKIKRLRIESIPGILHHAAVDYTRLETSRRATGLTTTKAGEGGSNTSSFRDAYVNELSPLSGATSYAFVHRANTPMSDGFDDDEGTLFHKSIDSLTISPGKVTRTPHSVHQMEHELAWIMGDLEISGIKFDLDAANRMYDDLKSHQMRIEVDLKTLFPPEEVIEPFNPTPGRLADALYNMGWQPTHKKLSTASGKPSMTPTALDAAAMHFKRMGKEDEYETTVVIKDFIALRKVNTDSLTTREQVDTHFADLASKKAYLVAKFPPTKSFVEFSVSSRAMVGRRLIEHGWVPDTTDVTDKGAVQVTDDTLAKALAFFKARDGEDGPLTKAVDDTRLYYLIQKRLGQLSDGKVAWMKCVDSKGFIHPTINPCGAVTSRATHSDPNVSQVPGVLKVKRKDPETGVVNEVVAWGLEGEWGADSRAAFVVPKGFKQVGADLKGIELRGFAHELHPYDQGRMAQIVLTQDIHEINRSIIGFANRTDAKRFIFAMLYGGGLGMLGFIINPAADLEARKELGRTFKAKTQQGISGFEKLTEVVQLEAEKGWITGLDGRVLPVRAAHAALNLKLQSFGAIIAKQWIIEVMAELAARGYDYGYDRDFTFLLWSHDEIQFAVREEIADEVAEIFTTCAILAGQKLGCALPIEADVKIGNNWYETH